MSACSFVAQERWRADCCLEADADERAGDREREDGQRGAKRIVSDSSALTSPFLLVLPRRSINRPALTKGIEEKKPPS